MHTNPVTAEKASTHLSEAADWLVTLSSGECTSAEQADFQRWLQDKDNAQAYKALQHTWQKFDVMQPQAAQKTLNYALDNKPDINSFYHNARLFSIAAAVGLTLLLASQSQTARFISADYYSLTEQSQRFTLPDNSTIQLLPRSAVNIHYNQHGRNIELIKGQVFIDVARDTNRPLTITSQHGSATALGTAFSVADKGDFTQVKVTESTVRVCAKAASSRCKTLRSGQQTQVNTEQIGPVQDSAKQMVIDWQQQTLTVDNQSLVTVLELLQQHYAGYLKYDRQTLQGLTISGVFSLQNTQASLQLIATILPVSVEQYAGMVLVVNKEN